MKNNFPLQKMLDFFLVQDRVLDRVQDKVGLRKFSSNFFVCKKPEKCYVCWRYCEKKIPFKTNSVCRQFLSKTESKTES